MKLAHSWISFTEQVEKGGECVDWHRKSAFIPFNKAAAVRSVCSAEVFSVASWCKAVKQRSSSAPVIIGTKPCVIFPRQIFVDRIHRLWLAEPRTTRRSDMNFIDFAPPSQGLTDLLIRAVAGTYSVVSLADSQLVEEQKKSTKSTAYLIYRAGSALKSFPHMQKTIDKSRNVQISV